MTYKFDTNNLSAAISVRLEPRLRYLLLIALRIKRQTLCRFITELINQDMPSIIDKEMTAKLWDIDPTQRFIKLAIYAPELLTYEEQVQWAAIKKANGFTKE